MGVTKRLFTTVVILVSVGGLLLAQTPPKDPKAEKLRSQAADLIRKDTDKAIELLNQALKIDPNYGHAYSNLGLAYEEKGDYDRAISYYNQAIKLDPNYSMAYANRGVTYNSMALAYNNRGGELEGFDKNKAKGNFDKAIESFDKAIEDYTKAIKLDPQNDYAYYNRCLVYFYKNNYDRAIADCKQAIKINPNREDYSRFLEYLETSKEEPEITDSLVSELYTGASAVWVSDDSDNLILGSAYSASGFGAGSEAKEYIWFYGNGQGHVYYSGNYYGEEEVDFHYKVYDDNTIDIRFGESKHDNTYTFTYEVANTDDEYVLVLSGMVYHPGRVKRIKVTTKYHKGPWYN